MPEETNKHQEASPMAAGLVLLLPAFFIYIVFAIVPTFLPWLSHGYPTHHLAAKLSVYGCVLLPVTGVYAFFVRCRTSFTVWALNAVLWFAGTVWIWSLLR